MTFVPLTGPAQLRPAVPARHSTIEFTDHRRVIALPVVAAIPVLSKALQSEVHPSVGLLGGATLMALRLVAAGRFEPGPDGWAPVWGEDDPERVRLLAEGWGGEAHTVRAMVAAVVDAMPQGRPTAPSTSRPGFRQRLEERLRQPEVVTISLRVEADEETLSAGSLRLVLQVHDEQNPLHLCDAVQLWESEDHGFSPRARTHVLVALRGAAAAWPVLDRLLELPAPDQIVLDADEVGSLLEDGVGALQGRGVDVLWPRSLGRELTATAVLEKVSAPREGALNTGLFGNEFAFQWQLAIGGEPLTPEEMDSLAGAAGPVLRLRGAWAVVPPAVARKARRRLLRAVAPSEALAAALTGVVEVEDVPEQVVLGATIGTLRAEVVGAGTGEPLAEPRGLEATLRDYQRVGLTWLADLTGLRLGGCLADDMGLGKTITLVALQLHRVATGAAGGPTLVVCPTSLLGNWEAEIARFAPGVAVTRFHGSRRELATEGFVLTTYGTMRNAVEALSEVPWDLVVADEAQHIKNPRSATARALRQVPSTARVALTGTPVENNLTELWAILDWVVPGLLGSRNAFRRRWAAPIEAGIQTRTREFADLIAPFLLRRRKSDPGIAPELPAKTETDHPLRLTREQTVLYEAYVRDTMARIERLPGDDPLRRGLVLAFLTGLKQICNHPAHFLKQASGRVAGRSEKVDLLDELLPTVISEQGGALVFTQYVAMARLLERHWSALGIEHRFLHGGSSVSERERMVKDFQAGEFPVFLLSLQAGGTGLNLTRADHVVHVDRWWNPAVEDQATDRAYRIGQTKPVQVHRLLTQGTIETRIAELLAKKRGLADAVLRGGDQALTELSNDELHELVRLA